jgi:hypothetical protein
MSNQVYSSATNKFQTYPGYNRYALTANHIVPYNQQDVISGFTAELVMQPQSTSMSGSSLTILETGMYSIKAQVELIPELRTLSALVDVLLTTNDARNGVAMIDIGMAESVDTVNAIPRSYDSVYVGWLCAGDVLQLRVTNKNIGLTSQTLTVAATSSRFIVSRIY